MDPVRFSDRIDPLFTRDYSGTGPERIQTGPAALQVQFWIRLDPFLRQDTLLHIVCLPRIGTGGNTENDLMMD